MKQTLCLAASLLAINLTPLLGQPVAPLTSSFEQRLANIQSRTVGIAGDVSNLTKFSLDFPGGTPKELAAAIEKATGKPLNVIIFDEDAGTKLPPIKMSDQNVANLFETLSENSVKYTGNRNEIARNYGFKTIDQSPSDNSLWTFYAYTKPILQTRFSLDFPGGTPAQLVQALEKAMGKPLNVIINKEDADVELPALKMDDVYLPQLFTALEVASTKAVAVNQRIGSYSQVSVSYGFKTTDGAVSDTSVWYFQMERPALPPLVSDQPVCKFYTLSYYLDRGFTVDDITTAIQTGWKLAGETSPPKLNYHKETRMLIAYGEPDELATIQHVLETLPTSKLTRDEVKEMQKNIHDLQVQLETLQHAAPGATPAAPAAEKSGK